MAPGVAWVVFGALLVLIAFAAGGLGIDLFAKFLPPALAAWIVGAWLMVRPSSRRGLDAATVLGVASVVFALYVISTSTPKFTGSSLALLTAAAMAAALSATAAWRATRPGAPTSVTNELRHALAATPFGLLAIGALVGAGPSVSLILVVLAAALLSRLASVSFAGGFLVMAGLSTTSVYMSSLLMSCGGGPAAVDADGTIVRCLGDPNAFFFLAAAVGVLVAIVGAVLIATSIIRRPRRAH